MESAYRNFSSFLTYSFNKCCPYTKVKQKIDYQKSPWITLGILKSIRHKNNLYHTYIRKPTIVRKTHYTKYKNRLTSVIVCAKKMYYCNIIKEQKNDTTQLWKILNKILNKGNKNECSKSFLCDHRLISDDNEIPNQFNAHFSSVAKNLANNLPISKQAPLGYITHTVLDSFVLFPTEEEEVWCTISKLNQNAKMH